MNYRCQVKNRPLVPAFSASLFFETNQDSSCFLADSSEHQPRSAPRVWWVLGEAHMGNAAGQLRPLEARYH